MRADRLAMAASAAVTDRRHDLVSLAPPQPAALGRAPGGTRLGTPVFTQGCDRTTMVSRVRAVPQRMPLCGSSPSRLAQQGHPLPEPWRSIGAKEDGSRPGARQALHGEAEQGAHRRWPCARGVHAGGTAGRVCPLGLHPIPDQPRGGTPGARVTPPPLLGPRSPGGRAPPQASPITAAHAAPPRHRGCTRRALALWCQPGAGRRARGAQPPRLRLPRYAPGGQHILGLGPSAPQRGAPTPRGSPRRGATSVHPSQDQAGRPTRVPVARSPLALAAGRGEPYGHGEPGHRPHHHGARAIVLARLGPRAHQWRWRGLAGGCLQSLLQVLPDP